MCGIAGLFRLGGPGSVPPRTVARMVAALRHRGPDGTGLYVDDRAGLGHARLAIIDIEGGTQPLPNEDETLWIVFNGEIFNYIELRRELLDRGHAFRTATDTEVILHLYEETGAGCLERLNGQFAFAIRDSRRQELFLARDRLGILPLHYALRDGALLFASEIKALFASGLLERRLDPVALDQVFTFWTTLPGRTAFEGIHELPPGHCLTLSDGRMALRRYWEISFRPPTDRPARPFGEACEAMRDLIRDAVRIRLRADVPVGCYVSGGLDSSGITALVKRGFDNRLRTFGIRFEEKPFDEREHQDFIVAHLETDHTAVTARNDRIGASFPDVVWHAEKPLLRTAPVPLFLLSEAVRDSGFKVVLTGEGADEVFGGYDIFKEAKIRRFWARHPGSTTRPLLVGRLYPDIFRDPRLGRSLQAFFGTGLARVDDPFYSHTIRWQGTSRLKRFFSEDLKAALGGYCGTQEIREGLPEAFGAWDGLAKAQYLETVLFLSSYLLSSQGDRVAMAHGVEVRPPFLDHRIVAFMASVPSTWKLRGLNEKYLLKKCFGGILPERIVGRPKHPYRAPVAGSLLAGSGPGWAIEDILSEESLREANLFDPQKVGVLLKKLRGAAVPGEFDGMALAGIVSAQILFRRFVSRPPGPFPEPAVPGLFIDRRSDITP